MALGTVLPSGYATLEDANGSSVPGGLIWTYQGGTSTPLVTYSDPALTIPNTNPIVADGAGRWVAWVNPGTIYKLVYETPPTPPATHGAIIRTVDNLSSVPLVSNSLVLTNHGVVIGQGASPLVATTPGTAGYILTSNGASADPTFQPSPAFPNITNHGVVIAQGANPPVATTPGTAGQVLTSQGPTADPVFTTLVSDWQTQTFNAADYSAVGGGTWTVAAGNRLTHRYRTIGKSIQIHVDIEPSTLAGTVTQLNINLPAGILANTQQGGNSTFALLSGNGIVLWHVLIDGGNKIVLVKQDQTAFAPDTNFFVRAAYEFEIR